MFVVTYTLEHPAGQADVCHAGPFEARSAAETFAAGLPNMAAHVHQLLIRVHIEDKENDEC